MGALRPRLMRPPWRPPRPSMPSWCARASSRSRRSGIPNSPATCLEWGGASRARSGEWRLLWRKAIPKSQRNRFRAAISRRRRRPRQRPCGSKSCTACNARWRPWAPCRRCPCSSRRCRMLGWLGSRGTTMACSVLRWCCAAPFPSEAQGSLRGRAGAFFPSGSGLEEEAGEGEGEDGEVQAKAREAPPVQQPEVLSCKYRKLRKSCTSQFQTARWSQNHVRVPENIQIRHVPFKTIHVFFHVWWGFKFKVADLSPIHFRKLSATDGTKLDLNIGVSPGVWLCIYNPEVDPSKTVSSFKIYRIGLGYILNFWLDVDENLSLSTCIVQTSKPLIFSHGFPINFLQCVGNIFGANRSVSSLRAAGDQSSIQVPRRLQEQLEGVEASYQVQYSKKICIYYIAIFIGNLSSYIFFDVDCRIEWSFGA